MDHKMRNGLLRGMAVGVLSGIVISALVFARFGRSIFVKDKYDTAMLLTDSPVTGQCEAGEPQPLSGETHQSYVWRITNKCAAAQVVQITQLQRINNEGGLDPAEPDVITPYPATSDSIQPGQTVLLSVSANKTLGSKDPYFYKYQIKVGTSPGSLHPSRDPDIELWDK